MEIQEQAVDVVDVAFDLKNFVAMNSNFSLVFLSLRFYLLTFG